MMKSLPPVGNSISLTPIKEPEKVFESVFGDRSVFLYGSGTMALAASLVAVRKYRRIDSPEVLLPAYACPDLVSAALYAGLKPILIDLETGTPWMDLNRLRDQVGPNTVAVIAVHFLGIPERLADIRVALEGSDVLIVEDSAQLFPSMPNEGVWVGDLVVLSFGRGKPVSLLGGGAVLCKNDSLAVHIPLAEKAALCVRGNVSGNPRVLYKTKVNLYNTLLAPSIYRLLQYMPFLHLGETIYKPLEKIVNFGEEKVSILAANMDAYCRKERRQQDRISIMLESIDREFISDLTKISVHRSVLPLLRYPVLVKSQSLRDRLFDALSRAGLGCSKMYPKSLPQIEGLEGYFQTQGDFPEARLFSERLLTFPCHPGVVNDDVDSMKCVIEETFNI